MVAVEFAMVVPAFVMTVGTVMTVAMVMWAKYTMFHIAADAARFCTAQIGMTAAQLPVCAQAVVAQDVANIGNNTFCSTVSSNAQVLTLPPSMPNVDSRMSILSVTVNCTTFWVGLVNALPGIGNGGSNLAVVVTNGMPFLR